MYKLDLKKLDNPQGISALSTCQRDCNDESSRVYDQTQTVLIRPKEKKQEKTELSQIQQQKELELTSNNQQGLKDQQQENNQSNYDDSSISNDQNNYKNVINKYVNSLNKVLSNQDENKKSNLIVPRKQMYHSSLQEESQCSYYDSEENQQIQNNKGQSQNLGKNKQNGNMQSINQENSGSSNEQQAPNQANKSFKSKNKMTKAQQLNLLLQGSTKCNEKQNQMLQSSQCQQSEYAEGDEQLDENYSYYEVSFNNNENKQPKQSQNIQIPQGINQMTVQTTNLNQMQKNQSNQQKISKDKLASLNQSIQQSFYAKSIENKSSLNPKGLNNSLMNEEKLQAGSIAERCCKICLEGESTEETGQLLSPCRCNGSMQYIHEECLKTWLVSQQVDIDTAACELCKMEYNMEITIGKKFQLNHACQEGQISFASCLCLFILVAGMLSIIFLFAFKWNVLSDNSSSSSDSKSQSSGNGKNNQNNDNSSDQSSDNSFSYQLSILIACVVILIVILVLFIMSIKEAFFVDYMKTWRIYNFDKETIKKKKKNLNQKEKAQLNQQAATNARIVNMAVSQTINNQSMLRNQRGHRLSQQSQQINSLQHQQNEQIQNQSHISNMNNNNNNQTQNQSFDQQRQQQINRIQEQINRVSEQHKQQGENNSNRQKLFDQTIINNLIHDQSLNESYLNSTVLQLKANQNLNDSQVYKQQYNIIDQDKEQQIINNLIGNQEKDDYSLKQYPQQKQEIQDPKYNAVEVQKNQKGSLKIISSVSKMKKSDSNLSKIQQIDKYTIKQNINQDGGTIIKSSIVNQNLDDNYNASIQMQSINKRIIGDEQISQENSIDPSQYINKINKLLNDIPHQFQDVDGKQDIVLNVLITKPIKK
ncbi:hypothetical protein ABPG74_002058 [Tetrahymena malaccensis]